MLIMVCSWVMFNVTLRPIKINKMKFLFYTALVVVGFYLYLVSYSEKVVAEKSCADGDFFIQLNEYVPLTKLLGAQSEGNMMITYKNGTKEYISDVEFIGKGNQKIALFVDKKWQRYVFASDKIYHGKSMNWEFDCY